jgi:hypothetical protein
LAALIGGISAPADQQPWPPVLPGRWADAALSAPHHRHLLQLLFEDAPAPAEVDAAGLEVVRPTPRSQAQGEAPTRQRVDRGGLLGQQRRVRPERGNENVGDQLDPLGHRRGRGKSDQRLIVRIDEPVQGPKAGKANLLGALRPLHYPGPVDPAHRVRKPDSHLHRMFLPRHPGL